MKMSRKNKKELIDFIEQELRFVPEGQRIHLDKDLLEDLLFEVIPSETLEEYGITNDIGESLKVPMWNGKVLRKIDLSEISFENVSWYNDDDINSMCWDEGLLSFDSGDSCDYSNTNAQIDFTKSWEAKNYGEFSIEGYNFSGVDLSNNDMSKLYSAAESDLSNTGIILSPDMFPELWQSNSPEDRAIFYDVNLSNVDLSKFTVNFIDMFEANAICDSRCNLSNTGINIIADAKKIKSSDYYLQNYQKKFKNGEFVGCYINGKKIRSSEEKKILVQEKRKEIEQKRKEMEQYKQALEDLYFSIKQDINQQIKNFQKKL